MSSSGGFTAILGALISLESVPLVWYRMLLAVAFITAYLLVKKESFRVPKKGLLQFCVTGVLIAVHWIAFFKAIKVSNISVALVVMSTGAFFTSLIEPLFFKRRINSIEILLGFAVVVGLSIIFRFESTYTAGILYALLAAFLSALFTVVNGLFVKEYKPAVISLYQLLFGVVAISFFIGFTEGFTVDFFQVSTTDWYYLLVLSSICTAYAYIVSVEVMQTISPYTVMLTINLEPIYAIVLALFIFGEKEQMNPEFYYGASIVLFVVLLNGVLKNKSLFRKK